MQINSITNFYQNHLNQTNTSSTNFGNIYFGRPINPQKYNYDIYIFSNPNKRSSMFYCVELLKDAKLNGEKRFSNKEIKALKDIISTSKLNYNQTYILRNLLDVKSIYGDKLSFEDIYSFFYVNELSTFPQQKIAIKLLKNRIDNSRYAIKSLDNDFFLPVENHPELLKMATTLDYQFKDLHDDKRMTLINKVMNIVVASDCKFISSAQAIAKKVLNDNTGLITEILLTTSEKLNCDENCYNANAQSIFSKMLSSLTPDETDQILLDTAYFTTQEQRKDYINKYVDKFFNKRLNYPMTNN